MVSFEKVSEDKIDGLITALFGNRTLIKVAVPGTDYEQLTIIIEIKRESGGTCFKIDPPEGLNEAIQNNPNQSLSFEFSTEDRLPHRFEAPVKETASGIWLWCPELIKRYQLRNDFRIKTPANANATILMGETKAEMLIDNISLGGIFCHCPNSYKDLVSEGLQTGNIDMVFSYGGECQMVSVTKAVLRRVEGRTIARHFGVAFEFLHIKAEARRRLTQVVYEMQREYLRNRSRKK